VGTVFDGISYTGFSPPDTIAAAGYDYVIEAVNLTLQYYDKGGSLLFSTPLKAFFDPLGDVLSNSDPVVTFDVLTGRFLVGVADYSGLNQQSRFDLAVSNDANPFDGWQLQRYDMNDGVGGFESADYPRLGYNADAWYVTANMFLGTGLNHVDTLAIDKTSLAGTRYVVDGGNSNFTLTPAVILDANPGDPEWFVERGGSPSDILKIYQQYGADAPFFLANVSVPAYSKPPKALQLGGPDQVDTIDDRTMNATMIYGQLLTAHTVASGGIARVHWYQIDTTQGDPYLFQWGEIDQGPTAYTYMPSISMNYEGDIGMTFMESDPNSEYVSMYVTGQSVHDWGSGTMQTPMATHPGTSYFTLYRAGDYSGITVDPTDGYSFWAANEYKGSDPWNTGIANFGVSYNGPEHAARDSFGLKSLLTVVGLAPATSATPGSVAGQSATTSTATTTCGPADQQAMVTDWGSAGQNDPETAVMTLSEQASNGSADWLSTNPNNGWAWNDATPL
jgi:hypothetical protein